MRILKEIKTEIPTIQYGNIEIRAVVEFNSEVDELTKETFITARKISKQLDREVSEDWETLHSYIEENLFHKISRINYGKEEKETSIRKRVQASKKALGT